MSWSLLTDDWRIKLLALGLAILMLGAVAFSQNPPTTGTTTIPISYTVPTDPSTGLSPIVLLDPPNHIPVSYSGLADVISKVTVSNLVATVDATHAKPGDAVKLNVVVKALVNITVQQPAPIAVKIEPNKQVTLQVSVAAQAAPGWSINTAKTYATCPGALIPNPCTVNFVGPADWEKGLSAYVAYPPAVNLGTIDSPNYKINLENSSGQVDLADIPTTPQAGLDVTSASIHIEALPGSTSSTVPLLDSLPSHGPAPGYRVTDVRISPLLVTITGDPVALGKVHSITLPGVDLSGKTSDATFQVQISYPPGTNGPVQIASVRYFISANPNVSPSP
ncbi:MAG TPA: CdaR family protein [Candidatus Dormibacteraeota bacterium]